MVSNKEYSVAIQGSSEIFTKIEILDFNFNVIDNLNGVVIETPNFTNDESSDIRRTCSLSLVVKDSSFDISEGNKVWLNRYIKIYIGIKDNKSSEIIYTNMGIYLINNPNRVYNSTENTLSFQCIDMMSLFTGLRNGQLEGIDYTIKANTNIKNFLIQTLDLFSEQLGITILYDKNDISECYYDDNITICNVPNDITIATGSTAYDLLREIININTSYQMYFDVDGYFHYNKIPKKAGEFEVVADDKIWDKNLIGYEVSTDFENVKNIVEVLGHTWDVSYFGECLDAGGGLSTIIDNIPFNMDDLIGFKTPNSNKINPFITISNNIETKGNLPIIDEANKLVTLQPDTTYVGLYRGDHILYKSQIQAKAVVYQTDSESPFNIDKIGKIRIVLQDGNYGNLYSDLQCQSCAENELYKRCLLNDSITINTIPIYWLDVNVLIELTLKNKNGIETTNQYLIKSISTSDTQTIKAMRVYE